MTNARAAEVLSMAATYNGCGRATSDELKEALSIAKDLLQEKPYWIPVEDRFPESSQRVIVCRKGGKVEQGIFLGVNGWWKVYGTNTKAVTHWMPMPEPPKEG